MDLPVHAKSGIERGSHGAIWATPLSGHNPAGNHYKHKTKSPEQATERYPPTDTWNRSGVDQAEPVHISADESEHRTVWVEPVMVATHASTH